MAQTAWQKLRQEINQEIIREKKGNTCSRCKGRFSSESLHYHHLDPATKKFELSSAGARSKECVLAEIDKCVPVCNSCHRAIHKAMKIGDNPLHRKCVHCALPFLQPSGRGRPQIFCSRRCNEKDKSIRYRERNKLHKREVRAAARAAQERKAA